MEFLTKIKLTERHVYTPPELGGDIEMLPYEAKKENQYWRRQDDLPDFFYEYNPHELNLKKRVVLGAEKTVRKRGKLISLSVEDTEKLEFYMVRELMRMIHGVYVMINGVATYFPGVYYGTLQWCKMFGVTGNDGYGEQREAQLYVAYLYDYLWQDDRWKGCYIQKPKKSGASQLFSCFPLIRNICNRFWIAGVMSKDHRTCKAANFEYYKHALKGLPKCLRPEISSKAWENAAQIIEFDAKEEQESLGSKFAAVPTVTNGFDGLPPVKEAVIDEPPKFPVDKPIDMVIEKTKEQISINKEPYGRMYMLAYPPEEDGPNFFKCKTFYYDSKEVMDDGISTKTGFIAYYSSILDNTNGTFDKYGKPDRAEALRLEMAARANCDTAAKLQSRKRQYHFNEKESWESGGGGSVYNNILLSEARAYYEDRLLAKDMYFTDGWLEYQYDELSQVSGLYFRPITQGEIMAKKVAKWRIFLSTEEEIRRFEEQYCNKTFKMPKREKFINGALEYLFQPPEELELGSGFDPVDYAYLSDIENPSKNAIVTKFCETGDMALIYYGRDEDPDITTEDAYKHILYTGSVTNVEANKRAAGTALKKMGLWFFMLEKDEKGNYMPHDGKKSKPISTGTGVIQEYTRLTTARINKNAKSYKDLRVYDQLINFDAADTRTSDIAVADGLSEICIKAINEYMVSKKNRFKEYENIAYAMGKIS